MIEHLFIHCSLARYAWRVVKCSLGKNMNLNYVRDMCIWVMEFPINVRNVIAVGIASVLWAL